MCSIQMFGLYIIRLVVLLKSLCYMYSENRKKHIKWYVDEMYILLMLKETVQMLTTLVQGLGCQGRHADSLPGFVFH